MKESFDFENIGKKTPYKIPENFFDNLEKGILDKTINKKQKNKTIIYYITAFSSIAASIALFIQLSNPNDTIIKKEALAQKEITTIESLESSQQSTSRNDTIKNNTKSVANISTSETSLDAIIKNTPTNELKEWEDIDLENEIELENELEEF